MFELYLKGEKINAKLRPFITAHIKAEGLELLKKIDDLDPQYKLQLRMIEIVQDTIGKEAGDFGTDYMKLVKDGKISKEQLNEMTKLGLEASRIQPEAETEKDKLKIELLKLLIKETPEKLADVWDDMDFWNEQNIEEIDKQVSSFREKFA